MFGSRSQAKNHRLGLGTVQRTACPTKPLMPSPPREHCWGGQVIPLPCRLTRLSVIGARLLTFFALQYLVSVGCFCGCFSGTAFSNYLSAPSIDRT